MIYIFLKNKNKNKNNNNNKTTTKKQKQNNYKYHLKTGVGLPFATHLKVASSPVGILMLCNGSSKYGRTELLLWISAASVKDENIIHT